jgi:hypothetical protein
MLNGVVGFVVANTPFELVIEVTVNAVVPAFEIESVALDVCPAVTLPKLSEDGVTPIFGAAVPLPATYKFIGGLESPGN